MWYNLTRANANNKNLPLFSWNREYDEGAKKNS